ncbi:MAG TPA: hypothetical protein VHQ46_04420, partial [Desulfobacteria bacterium]|nr:hypothetical protein [Desulfobacteria bacterium]
TAKQLLRLLKQPGPPECLRRRPQMISLLRIPGWLGVRERRKLLVSVPYTAVVAVLLYGWRSLGLWLKQRTVSGSTVLKNIIM